MGKAGPKQNTKAEVSLPHPPPSSSFMFTRHSVHRTPHLSGSEHYHVPFQGFHITHTGLLRLLLILSPFYRLINRGTEDFGQLAQFRHHTLTPAVHALKPTLCYAGAVNPDCVQGDFLPYAYRLQIPLPSASLLCQYLLLGKDLFSIIYTLKGI